MYEHKCTKCAFFEVCEDRFRFWSPKCKCYLSEAAAAQQIEDNKRKDTNRTREKMLQQKKKERKNLQRIKLKKIIALETKALLIFTACVFPAMCKDLFAVFSQTNYADLLMVIFLIIAIPMLIFSIYSAFYRHPQPS